MKFIPYKAEFGNEGLRIDLGYTGNERRDGKYNSIDNPKDWCRNLFVIRLKYLIVVFIACRLIRYPFGFYYATSGGARMFHVRVFWLQLNIHYPSWFLIKNRLSV
jgi:hypothetical protein